MSATGLDDRSGQGLGPWDDGCAREPSPTARPSEPTEAAATPTRFDLVPL